jgi:hypothetical protein
VCAVLDGNQVLDFYWTEAIDAMKRFVGKLQYKDKLYTTFQPGTSALHPNARIFEKANSGMIFQSFYLLDMGSSQLVALFYADASFSGASMTHHPIYSEQLLLLLLLLLILLCISLVICIIAIIGIIDVVLYIVQCVCSICTRMSALGQEIGYLLGGCQYTTKSGISVLRKDLSPPLLERFDCTTSVGSNFWTDGQRGPKKLFFFHGQMVLHVQRACTLEA